MFADTVTIYVESGKGGDGCVSFRREKFIPRGGPNGGDGGRGGDVLLRADSRMTTLYDFVLRPHFKARSGGPGRGSLMSGEDGPDLVINVPCGTVVWKLGPRPGHTLPSPREFVADLTTHGQTLLVAKGGRGGRGNTAFKSSTNRAPRVAELGEPGQKAVLLLELKLIADVGLAGLPNAGKSTLLSRITAARPKIAPYPFTTLSPNLGVCVHHMRSFVIADIPGLIEDAHTGKGLGTDFLRHIERTRIIAHVIDLSGMTGMEPVAAYRTVLKELRSYSPALIQKPSILILTKADTTDQKAATAAAAALRKAARSSAGVCVVSSVTGAGIEKMLDKMVQVLDRTHANATSADPEAPTDDAVVSFKRYEFHPGFTVARVHGVLTVDGESIRRAVAMTDFNFPEAVIRLRRRLRAMGVERLLKKNGVTSGERVVIADREFEFQPDDDTPSKRARTTKPA